MIGQKRTLSTEGGIETVVREISTRLASRGYSVTAYDRRGHHVSGEEYDNAQVGEYKGVQIKTVFTLDKKGLAAVTSSIAASFKAAFGKYDIVHYHAEGPSAFAWLPRLFGKKIVCHNHGIDHKRDKWKNSVGRHYIKYGEKVSAKSSHELIVLSRGIQNYFKAVYNKDSTVIANGVNAPEKRDAKEITEKWGLKKDGYILFLARLCPEKGLKYLINAYKALQTDKKLVIAGGSSDTEDFVEEMKALANKDPRIIFTGFVSGNPLYELYSNAYIYCLPSDLEGMPLSLLEAMSYGNCCLVSDIEECTAVTGDKAVTFAQGDEADLRGKLDILIKNPETVEAYRAGSADYILEKYSWDKVVDEVEKVYRRVMQ